jgi:signal transduction histidine kinase
MRHYHLQLQSLTSELERAEERERKRLAANLHDGISQMLAITMIKLDGLRLALAASPHAEELNEMRDLLVQTIENTHTVTFDLCPRVLYELGFEAATESLVEQIQIKHNILTRLVSDRIPILLDNDIRIMLYQALRELLINVVKHAQAKSILVSIQHQESRLLISVHDDGIGFSVAELDSRENLPISGGFGIFHIRERLKYLHGAIEIESAAGQGTRITMFVPLKKDKC